ncbi:prolyl 4-hydroxylase [Hephaestia caeni]|uniref:Prolyl 4-hydroxylase n=1 Tax=Hephaestia caeni TaxID=645617 RepID=A0A397PIB1_9SPHN|nr:2OG-Fe(II) oxygenase [Hephaestia caeni]RIA46897.1 prolyl 4-hydroxylase [Hephaestia caeni]
MSTPPARVADPGSGLPADHVLETLRAQPAIQRVPTPKLTLFARRGFLDPETCAAVIDRIDARRRPSTIADANGDTAFRTSETCDLDSADPVIDRVEALISAFTGLDRAYGEPVQGQRYAVGQEFKAHTDYFEPGGEDYKIHCRHTGNRTWTVMIYLNQPGAGGATRFKAIDKTIQPETGKLLAWNNRRPDGLLNPATLHHGMKVRSGTKYIITKWFRERPWPRPRTEPDA